MNSAFQVQVVTDNAQYPLRSDFINYLFAVDRLYKYCIEVREHNSAMQHPKRQAEELIKKDKNRFAGPLASEVYRQVGAQNKSSLMTQLDSAVRHSQVKATDRLHWASKSAPPVAKASHVAPIAPATGIDKRNVRRAGTAAAIGIIIQSATAAILYRALKRAISKVIEKVKQEHPNATGTIMHATILYLRVSREAGRAPMIAGVYVDKIISKGEIINPVYYVRETAESICVSQLKKMADGEVLIDSKSIPHLEQYQAASLFLNVSW